MEEYRDSREQEHHPEAPGGHWGTRVNRWLGVSVLALLVVAGVAIGYGYRQQILIGHLTAQGSAANATISQMQGQVNSLTAKLDEMTAAQTAASGAHEAKQRDKNAPAATHSAARQKAPVDSRYKKLQAQLAEQQKQLKETQELVAKNRSDLEGSLTSTRDELNGSIAKTHEELVALEKRGERSYFEFDLAKSKQFQRIGPLTLSLRKADTKHKNYNLELIVDDNQLTKKNVNLYEPIWIHTENESQPVQVVVNRIEKNMVHGYVSAPKYKPSELAASVAAPAVQTSQTSNPPQP